MKEILLFPQDPFELSQSEYFLRLLIAMGVGFVIGLEREYSSLREKENNFAGIRTFILIVLFGFLSAWMQTFIEPALLIMCFSATIFLTCISYYFTSKSGEIGGTSEFAVLVSFLIGVLIYYGLIQLSLILMVLCLIVLSLKVKLRRFVKRLDNEEVLAIIRFASLALLLLPFIPNEKMGPYGIINLYELGLIIVLTSGIGFLGYMAIKFLGSKDGTLLAGLIGGLVSSTAVTWDFSKKSANSPSHSPAFSVAILAASSIMILRVGAWLLIFNKELLSGLFVPLTILFLVTLGLSLLKYLNVKNRKVTKEESTLKIGNPLNIKEAVVFGILFVCISFLLEVTNKNLGSYGIYLATFFSSLTDIDAITISMSKFEGPKIDILTAQNAILLAAISNTLFKMLLAIYFGSKELKKIVFKSSVVIMLAGLIGFLILNF